MNLSLQSMAIDLPPIAAHPNRAPFRGVLTLVDVPSDRAPAGARGHRVVLTRAAAERALPSLLGMGLDYAPALDRHDAQRKIGIITEANIVASRQWSVVSAGARRLTTGDSLEVSGYIFGRDFPEIVRALRFAGEGARATSFGMSYEITDARVEDVRAAVWTVTEFLFTGAAVLRRDKAAYRNTWIELT
jgi:hypothetical protein